MDYNHLVDTIEGLAAARNITLTKAYADSGVGKDFSYNVRRGIVPSADKLRRLAEYFDVTIDYLMGLPDKEKPAEHDELDERNEKIKNIMTRVRKLSPEKLSDAVKHLDYLLSQENKQTR